jgi:branched-chain amino acid transport system permease protein
MGAIMNLTAEILLQNVASGLLFGLIYALVAVGLALVYGLMEFVNFAHGEYLMLSMYFAFWAHSLWAMDPLLSLPMVVIILFVVGVLTYTLIIRRLLNTPMVTQMFATFGLAIFLRSVAQFLWTADYRLIPETAVSGRINMFGIFISQPQLVSGVVTIACFVGLYLLMQRTRLGRAMRATAQDRRAAEVMGINTNRINLLAWGIALGLVGVAGVLLSTFTYVGPYVGTSYSASAFVAVALGGFGSVPGALIGAVIVGVVEGLAGLFIDPGLKNAIVFALYIAVVLFRPRGLMGRY